MRISFSLINKLVTAFAFVSITLGYSQTNGDAIIYPEVYKGKTIDNFFYDVKFSNKNIKNTNQAKQIFELDGMNGIRIPIFGDDPNPAHPSAGVVIDSFYTDVLKSIELAKAARNGKEFIIFASKKLNGQNLFPDWVKNANGVIVNPYVRMLTDYILFMKSKGIEIDYLGMQNEEEYNEGNVTPQKHVAIVDSLKVRAVRLGFKMPKIVAYEGFGPNKDNWMGIMNQNNWLNRMDVYGTHYYPHIRPYQKLQTDLNFAGNKPFWSTEPHWDSKPEVDDWEEAEKGICALWDQVDLGMSGFMWWAYERSGSLRGNLMREFSVPIHEARNIDMDDVDGRNTSTYNKLQSRAFRKGNTIVVYVVNNTATVRNNYGFNLQTGVIVNQIDAKQWVKSENSPTPNIASFNPNSQNSFSFNLPAFSISSFTFTYASVMPSPSDITDLSVSELSCTSTLLKWSDTDGETGYRIRRKLTTDAAYTNLMDVPANITSFTDTGLEENLSYIYMVRPVVNNQAVAVSNTSQISLSRCNVTSINSENESNSLEIYPNPTIDKVYLNGEFDSWELLDAMGNFISKGEGKELMLSDLGAGIYFLKVNNQSFKICKQ